ncbi:MAG: hypothetical protein AMXMBFR36_03190 [Acidobacteriota bacterium]
MSRLRSFVLVVQVAGALASYSAIAAAAPGGWEPPAVLDPGTPLELTRIGTPAIADVAYLGVLFDEPVNSLELARVALSQEPPTATFVPVASGGIFALGPIVEASGKVGFPYLDSNFDLFFAQCTPPCNSVTHPLVHPGSNYVDTSAAAAGGRFYVAATDFASGSIIVRSSFDGTNWAPHRTLAPVDLYVNFDGGKRIQLIVDPAATDPSTAFNCLLYELLPPPGTVTQVRINCANGDTVAFNQAIDFDLPNPLGKFDSKIETAARVSGNGREGPSALFAYTHRSSNTVRGVVVDPSGILDGPVVLSGAPDGDLLYGLGVVSTSPGSDRMIWPNLPGDLATDVEWNPIPGPRIFGPGPAIDPGPITLLAWEQTGDPADAFLFAFAAIPASRWQVAPIGGSRLGVSRFRLPFFEDGFEGGDTLAWSVTVP